MENNNYHFENIGAEEEILQVVHRSGFYILEQFLVLGLMFVVLAFAFLFAPRFFPMLQEAEFYGLFLFVESLFLLALWVFGFLIWIDYYFDIWIITSRRIINIEQKGLFSRKVSELDYAKVQDVAMQVQGFLPTMLNFGDIEVQTAGEEENFRFRTVSNPYAIKDLIVQQVHKEEGLK